MRLQKCFDTIFYVFDSDDKKNLLRHYYVSLFNNTKSKIDKSSSLLNICSCITPSTFYQNGIKAVLKLLFNLPQPLWVKSGTKLLFCKIWGKLSGENCKFIFKRNFIPLCPTLTGFENIVNLSSKQIRISSRFPNLVLDQ